MFRYRRDFFFQISLIVLILLPAMNGWWNSQHAHTYFVIRFYSCSLKPKTVMTMWSHADTCRNNTAHIDAWLKHRLFCIAIFLHSWSNHRELIERIWTIDISFCLHTCNTCPGFNFTQIACDWRSSLAHFSHLIFLLSQVNFIFFIVAQSNVLNSNWLLNSVHKCTLGGLSWQHLKLTTAVCSGSKHLLRNIFV